MQGKRTSLDAVENFLAQKRIAMVGRSREAKSMSAILSKELSLRGHDVVPVNPHIQQWMGRKCFARVQEIEAPVDGALQMTSPAVTEAVVQDCAAAGSKRVWMRGGGGQGAVSPKAIEACRQRGISVIAGGCPRMFLIPSGGIHRLHGFVRKLTGRFPRHSHPESHGSTSAW